MATKMTELFGIKYPIIQGGMVWCSGWKLASAVTNCGGLGLLGAGSMHPDTLREHIQKCKAAVNGKPFGVNVPLMYPELQSIMDIIIAEGVPVVFTSAGSPKAWTKTLQGNGIKVAHVVSSALFAKKCEEAGVDAIVAEGFEAGGHNGREETATMPLIPRVRQATSLPLAAAGGIATGRGLLAALALGADGVQMGTRFALAAESSAHEAFKNLAAGADEGSTILTLKKLAPVRMLRNKLFQSIEELDQRAASADEYRALMGKGRSKKGIFEGNLDEGELEIGQCASLINKIQTVEEIFAEIIAEFGEAQKQVSAIQF